jgi:hypothetical protein
MKIVKDNKIYPDELVPVLDHYKEYFDAVKICFMPFFQLNSDANVSSRKASKQISFEELKEKDELFKKLSVLNAEIYESNEDYPESSEIIDSGEIVNWGKVITDTQLQDYREVNRALRTSIGAYKKPLRRIDLFAILEKYTEENKIWSPIEGQYDVFTKIGIYKLLKKLGIDEILVIDQYYEKKNELSMGDLSESEFIDKVKFDDYYIYSKDKSILFAISWDDFFYFIATKRKNLNTINEIAEIEGFVANDKDSHLWDWEEGEIEKILNAAVKSKEESWWKRLLKRGN